MIWQSEGHHTCGNLHDEDCPRGPHQHLRQDLLHLTFGFASSTSTTTSDATYHPQSIHLSSWNHDLPWGGFLSWTVPRCTLTALFQLCGPLMRKKILLLLARQLKMRDRLPAKNRVQGNNVQVRVTMLETSLRSATRLARRFWARANLRKILFETAIFAICQIMRYTSPIKLKNIISVQ